MGTSGVVYTLQREVKFYDLRKINKSESIPQGCFHRSRTKVGGSKTIRYRRSLNHKLCRPGIGDRRSIFWSFRFQGKTWSYVEWEGYSNYRNVFGFRPSNRDAFWNRRQVDFFRTFRRNLKCLGFGGSMVARLKLKGIDGRAHQEWSLRLNLTQHGETYQGQIAGGLTDWELFLDLLGGGAWSFLVGGVNCLVNSDNERDLCLISRCKRGSVLSGMSTLFSFIWARHFLKGLSAISLFLADGSLRQ